MGSFWGATQKQLSTKNRSGNLKGRWKPDMTRSSPRKQGYIWKGRFPQFWHNLKSRIQNKEDKSNQALLRINFSRKTLSPSKHTSLPPCRNHVFTFHNSSLLVNHPDLAGEVVELKGHANLLSSRLLCTLIRGYLEVGDALLLATDKKTAGESFQRKRGNNMKTTQRVSSMAGNEVHGSQNHQDSKGPPPKKQQ